jgi:hypothetical protein
MDLRDITRAAEDQGFRVERIKRGHVVIYPPDKRFPPVVFSGTPGDQRSIRNGLARLRQAGFIWPWAGRREKKR